MLAIIIPYFKLNFFEATLQSLADQTDKRFKVYIGDDASPEDCTVLLEKFQGQFDFEYHRFESNLGGISLTQQWERCIALSGDEEWLMILGDDDVLGENVVEEFHRNISEINFVYNVVRFSTYKINQEGIKTSKLYSHPKVEDSIDFLFRNTRSSLSEYIFKAQCVKNIRFKEFPLAWFSDVLAVLEFSDFKKIYSINEAQVFIRISNISISGDYSNFLLKAKANFEFNFYLLTKCISYFSTEQKKVLLKKISRCYLNDKKNINYFFKISKIYFLNVMFLEYLFFLKDIVLSVLTRKS